MLDVIHFRNRHESAKDFTLIQAAVVLVFISAAALVYSRILYAPCDDAYIFYVYAKNFVAGNGLTYNGSVTWGFTSILWVLCLSLVGLLGVPIHIAGEVLSSASGCFALWSIYYLGRNLCLPRSYALFPPGILAATGDFTFYMSTGLESVLFVGLVALACALVVKETALTYRHISYVAIAMAAMILTRPDGALLCLMLLILWMIKLRRVREPFICGILLICLVIPFFIAMRAYFGFWLPNSFYVKSNAGLMNLYQGVQYLQLSLQRYSAIIMLFGLALIRQLTTNERLHHSEIDTVSMMMFIILTWLTYVMIQGGDNMVGGRALIPVLPLFYVAVAKLSETYRMTIWHVVGTIFVISVMIVSYLLDSNVMRHAEAWRKSYPIRYRAGLYLANRFPPDTLVALNPAGIIPYYSGLSTIDMLGLNNTYIAHNGKRDRNLRFGHQAGDGRYVLSMRPDVILFCGSLSARPCPYISDREIWRSPRFQQCYTPSKWPGIGTAYLRKPCSKDNSISGINTSARPDS